MSLSTTLIVETLASSCARIPWNHPSSRFCVRCRSPLLNGSHRIPTSPDRQQPHPQKSHRQNGIPRHNPTRLLAWSHHPRESFAQVRESAAPDPGFFPVGDEPLAWSPGLSCVRACFRLVVAAVLVARHATSADLVEVVVDGVAAHSKSCRCEVCCFADDKKTTSFEFCDDRDLLFLRHVLYWDAGGLDGPA